MMSSEGGNFNTLIVEWTSHITGFMIWYLTESTMWFELAVMENPARHVVDGIIPFHYRCFRLSVDKPIPIMKACQFVVFITKFSPFNIFNSLNFLLT